MPTYGGSNAKRHRMRCKTCRNRYHAWINRGKVDLKGRPCHMHCGRYTLKRHPDAYKKQSSIRCPVCKSTDVVSVEKHRRKEQLKADTCRCDMVPFPHRTGSIIGCVEGKPVEQWDDGDHEDYQSMIMTPRSG